METKQQKALDELAKEFVEAIFGPPPTKEELERLKKLKGKKKAGGGTD